MVCTIGFNPERLPKGYSFDEIDLRCVYTNLGVFDFYGPNHQMQIVSLHPGVTVEEVVSNTGFEVHVPGTIATTTAPTEEQLAVIRQIDPHNLRSKQLKDNPAGAAAVSQTSEVGCLTMVLRPTSDVSPSNHEAIG